jgi:hypothetical protein
MYDLTTSLVAIVGHPTSTGRKHKRPYVKNTLNGVFFLSQRKTVSNSATKKIQYTGKKYSLFVVLWHVSKKQYGGYPDGLRAAVLLFIE